MAPKDALNRLYSIPERSAEEAGLSYVQGETDGIMRVKKGKGFAFVDAHGKRLSMKDGERARSLGIPPAWTDVWISPDPNAHLLATGRDEKGRKQYIYHPKWNELRNTLKFYRLILFSEQLPSLRSRMKRDLRARGLTREKIIAAALSLMDKLYIRIGNEEYAKSNKTYGLTTLEDKHVEIRKGVIQLKFVGKANKEHELEINDVSLAKVVKESKEVPGRRLFQYFDDEYGKRPLTSNEVNEYIRAATGYDFTAKDFRTWAATVEAYKLMKKECSSCDPGTWTKKDTKLKTKAIIEEVAEKLGNTPAICKSHYVHTDVRSLFENRIFHERVVAIKTPGRIPGLSSSESELRALLTVLYGEKRA